MTSSRRSWERLAGHLAGRFRLFAYDQRGHGDSAAVPGPMALERGVRDAENVAAAIGEPVDALIGHSWGGAVAILAGTRLPVARVAAVDPMIHQASDEWYNEFLEELRELFALTGAARDERTRADYGEWHAADVEGKVHAVHSMTAAPIEALWKQNPAASWDLRPLIARYPKPLLLALAGRGEGINDDAAVDQAERDRSPEVTVVRFPGAGHNLHRAAFDEFARALDAWL